MHTKQSSHSVRALRALALVLVTILPWGCGRTPEPARGDEPAPAATRGYILISVDTLRADHLGAYGYSRDTSPFFDRLAARGVLFEKAIVQLPGTLPSHMSIFTGLYPAEHAVYPPSAILSPQIETLPEVFRRHGFRTAGFTEGGYMSGRYGFARGFERFDDRIEARPDDIERTFEKGLDFLQDVAPSERFFLFLHTYAVHDPYTPPAPYHTLFWTEEPPSDAFAPTGPHLTEVNRGTRQISPEVVQYFQALYDGGIRYTDSVLERFFDRLEELGLDDEITVVITSDHGEEFHEHGGMVHEQVYDETLHVPLLLVHPDLEEGQRIHALTQSIDLAPTLYHLARIDPSPKMSGRSLVPYLTRPDLVLSDTAYAEGFATPAQTLYRQLDGEIFQFLQFSPVADRGGFWALDRQVVFDTQQRNLTFESRSFHQPRSLVVSADRQALQTVPLDPQWRRVHVDLPASDQPKQRIRLDADGCVSPRSLGQSEDGRCLSFQVRGLPLERTELYNVTQDPLESHDLSNDLPDLHRALYHALRRLELEPAAAATEQQLDPELEQRLKSLGYLQ